MRNYLRIISLLVLAFGPLQAFGETNSFAQEQFEKFYSFVSNTNKLDTLKQDARSRLIQEKYNESFGSLFSHSDLNSLSKGDLHMLFEAASLASFENPDGFSYRDALSALHALGSDASDREVRAAQGMLFQSRKSQELNAFSAKYADRGLAAAPQFRSRAIAGRHDVLVPSGGRLEIENVDVERGSRVVVVAHPLCHFTRDAMKAIDADPFVKKAMHSHAVWIAPPDRNMDFTAFSEWHDTHPDAPIFIAYGYSSWPEMGEWGTPTFYFFKDGQLAGTIVGWPKGGRMNDLKAGLTKIGLAAE